MNIHRGATITSLCYSIPLTLWCLPLLQDAARYEEAEAVLQQAVGLVLLLQGIAVALFVPRFLVGIRRIDALSACLLLIAVPWPLLALAWLAESVTALPLLLSQLGLISLALLLRAASNGSHFAAGWQPLNELLPPLIQIAALALVLDLYSRWPSNWLA